MRAALTRRARPPPGLRLGLATVLEASWEIVENTDVIINRYREATMALDYYGDSILNSVSDIAAMIAGFFLASWFPVRERLPWRLPPNSSSAGSSATT